MSLTTTHFNQTNNRNSSILLAWFSTAFVTAGHSFLFKILCPFTYHTILLIYSHFCCQSSWVYLSQLSSLCLTKSGGIPWAFVPGHQFHFMLHSVLRGTHWLPQCLWSSVSHRCQNMYLQHCTLARRPRLVYLTSHLTFIVCTFQPSQIQQRIMSITLPTKSSFSSALSLREWHCSPPSFTSSPLVSTKSCQSNLWNICQIRFPSASMVTTTTKLNISFIFSGLNSQQVGYSVLTLHLLQNILHFPSHIVSISASVVSYTLRSQNSYHGFK